MKKDINKISKQKTSNKPKTNSINMAVMKPIKIFIKPKTTETKTINKP